MRLKVLPVRVRATGAGALAVVDGRGPGVGAGIGERARAAEGVALVDRRAGAPTSVSGSTLATVTSRLSQSKPVSSSVTQTVIV